ncbi:hypothetical protein [Marinobacter xestospongiae]|uniref:YD repeat-containing protein n=1 Tax=Marinobacter xestospongiae TaxID=994319 RepID=A0ABU3VTV5_9GAMM|nr:hypothetical protein [Marinobacter xestospongiae]MDV2077692.1 hypothetical protein [Marinobacter xestospongiae]
MFIDFKSTAGKARLAFVLSTVIGLAACGGGGSGGSNDDTGGGDPGNQPGNSDSGSINEQAATIQSEEDAKAGADAAVDSAHQAIIEEQAPDVGGLPTGASISTQSQQDWVMSLTTEYATQALSPTAAVTEVEGDCGGEARVNFNDSRSAYTVVYDNFCTTISQNETYVMDGVFEWFGYDNLETEWGYDFDYTVDYLGETRSYSGTYRCGDSSYQSCSYINNYEGRNGRQYRTENVSVYESNGAYEVDARVYDEELGYVDYEASDLVLCDGGYGFSAGFISIKDSSGNNVIRIDFSGCSSFTVTYNGVASSYNY